MYYICITYVLNYLDPMPLVVLMGVLVMWAAIDSCKNARFFLV